MSKGIWWLIGLVALPFIIEVLYDALGPVGRVLIPVLVLLGALRLLLALFIGNRAADHAIGRLAYDVIAMPFRLMAAGVGLILRAGRHGP